MLPAAMIEETQSDDVFFHRLLSTRGIILNMKSSFGTVDGRNVALPGMYKPCNTLPETNIAPENAWLDDEFPFGFRPMFRGRTVSFR